MVEDQVKEPLPVLDPAYRDVDVQPWVPGRFEERVRRAWNGVPSQEIHAAAGDLDRLTAVIHAKVGGEAQHIRHRLERFREMDARPDRRPRPDPLVRPGAAP